jgi:hypothetical protein
MKKATAALLPSPFTLEEEEEGDGGFVAIVFLLRYREKKKAMAAKLPSPSLLCYNKTNKKNA